MVNSSEFDSTQKIFSIICFMYCITVTKNMICDNDLMNLDIIEQYKYIHFQ